MKFTSTTSVKKLIFQNFKGPLYLIGWSQKYHFWLVFRDFGAVYEKCKFATLVKITQKM